MNVRRIWTTWIRRALMQDGVRTPFSGALADEKGAAALEFAFTIPVVLTLIFGILDCARLTFSQAALNFAAEEATRFAVVREGEVSNQDIQAFADHTLIDSFGLDDVTFSVATVPDQVSGTSVITVVGTYNFSFLLPFLPASLIQLNAESRGFLAFPGNNPGGGGG